MKKQVVVIHGGEAFDTYESYLEALKGWSIDSLEDLKKKRWRDSLEEALGNEYEVVLPKMPNKENAKYKEWKIWFEKLLPLLNEEIVFVGHSLGGIFLAKYISENKVEKKIAGTILVAAPFDSADSEYTLADFELPTELSDFMAQSGRIVLYHSKDDPVVPFPDLEKYRKKLPTATLRVFEDKQHFNQEKFPELVEAIKNLFK